MSLVERWQIYAVHVGNVVPSNAPITVPFQIDNDAPFQLRGRSIGIVQTDDTTSIGAINQLWTRFTDPAEQYRSSDVIPAAVNMPYGGASSPGTVYPQVPYPPGAIIQTQLYNDGAALPSTAVDVTVYYHGVKLFQPGNYGTTYPARCDVKPYAMTLPGPGRSILIQNDDFIQNFQLQVPGDFDYVFRGGTMGWSTIPGHADSGVGFGNLYVTVKDNQQRAYMNAPVAVAHVFAMPQSEGMAITRSPFAGDFTPGLFVPELYVPRNQYLFFDFEREDYTVIAGLHPCNIQIVFNGSKVYAK